MGRVLLYRIDGYSIHMADTVKGKRPYRSAKREEQARATRRSIVEAGHRLFVERGYVATTMDAIAAEADVAVQTVYATFGSKVEILKTAVDMAVAGDDEPVALGDREATREIAQRSDQRERVRLFAQQMAGIGARVAPLIEAVRSAAGASSEAAQLWEGIEASRLEGMTQVAAMIDGGDGLAVSLEEARDTLWVLFSSAVAVMLLTERQWPLARFENWLGRTTDVLLLHEQR